MNYRIFILPLFLFFYLSGSLKAQMVIGGQTLYGDEWIDYDRTHYKITLNEDGVYRLTYQELFQAGVFSESDVPTGAEFKLYRFGNPVPIYVNNPGAFSSGDYIEFYGRKNRGQIDMHLYADASEQLNPHYSMFSDDAVYFLTWGDAPATDNLQNVPNDLNNLPAAETLCTYKVERIFSDRSENGKDYGSSSWKCRYDLGEGYASQKKTSLNVSAAVDDLGVGTTKAKIRFLSYENLIHDVTLNLNNSPVVNETFSDWAVKEFSIDIPSSDFVAGANVFTLAASASPEDKFAVSYFSLDYPRLFNFGGQNMVEFTIPDAAGKRYLEINDFDISGNPPILIDLTHNVRLETTVSGTTLRAALPAGAGERKIILFNDNSVKSANGIAKRDFIQYDFANGAFDYIMITHPYFYDDGNGINYIQQYADYRMTPQGGEYNPLVVDVTQLYDQFGYGIDRHEMSIRNFMKKAELSWSPKLLYLIGKGVTYQKMRDEPEEWNQFSFVPSYGYPNSDHLFVTPINSPNPAMGVGRLACKNANQLRLYLDKVIEYEDIQVTNDYTYDDRAWMKNILHFGGGDENIQNFIKSELNELKDSIEVSEMAAEVTSFFKNSTGVIGEVPLDQVVPLINNGAAMLTFFGHSAPSTLDFDLGNPTEYQNQGKYPFFYAIGCSTNRIFEVESSLSEDFVFIEDRGCIGFFGSSWVTSLGSLSQYAREFYDNMGNDVYGGTIGDIIRTTIIDYGGSTSYIAELLRNSLVLHGDPAVRLYPYDTPDYIVNEEESFLDPAIVNVQEDSFDLNLVIANLGKGVRDSFNIRLQNELPNGSLVELGIHRVSILEFETEFEFRLPVQTENSIGSNYIVVTLDIDDEVLEEPMAAENNNSAKIPFFVVANDIFPIYPYDFSIVSTNTPVLQASTANVFSQEETYYFEIDTTELFDSPIKEEASFTSIGGVLDWQPPITMIDSTVYYWRVSIDSTAISGSGFNWHNSSFVYIDENPPGWNQSHYYQLIKDGFSDYSIEPDTRYQKYGEFYKEINVVNASYPNLGWIEIALFEDGFKEITAWPCPGHPEAIIMAVYDPVTLTRRINPMNATQEAPNCWTADLGWYIFYANDAAERAKIMDAIENVVQEDDYVVFYNVFREENPENLAVQDWASDSISNGGKNLFNVLESKGASQIRLLEENTVPYILIYQNDTDGSTNNSFTPLEVMAISPDQIIDASVQLTGVGVEGRISSVEIGPAQSWETLLWEVSEYDTDTENVNVDVVGIDVNGMESVVMDSITAYNQPLTTIDAATYPKIRLVYNSKDTIGHTTPQLEYWRVHYVPIPEAALVPNKQFVFHNDTLQQGEPLSFEIGVENISDVDMDSMLMHYTIIGSDNTQVLTEERLEPILNGERIVAEFDYDTRDLTGVNRIVIEANPDNDQPELYHYNNIGIREFYIDNDKRNPLLDVTFDGLRIMDGDIVSATPEILITLLDENPFLGLTDTSLLRVFLTDPEDNITEYYVDGNTLTFFPANVNNLAEENKARMEFRPELTVDGVYRLEVRGKDVTGNNSGSLDYQITFEVINEEMVSNVLNYPNPFSTSTQFVFTLTGNELPDYMKIQVMTISGKIVREITMDELGPLRIGNNITEYKWDGTDEYGDKLANGVYVYRVVTKKNGEDVGSYDTGTNKYFKRGMGKMVILR